MKTRLAAVTIPGVVSNQEGSWLRLEQPGRGNTDPFADPAAPPRLWKTVADGDAFRLVLDLPLARLDELVADEAGDSEDGRAATSPVEAVLAWCIDLPSGESAAWAPPARHEVEAWPNPAALTIQSGPLAFQGRLIHEPGRLGIAIPLTGGLAQLDAARGRHLHDLLLDANNRCRMARLAIVQTGAARMVEVQVDLTGVPACAAETLFRIGVDAARAAAFWLISSIAVIVDTSACRVLSSHPRLTGLKP